MTKKIEFTDIAKALDISDFLGKIALIDSMVDNIASGVELRVEDLLDLRNTLHTIVLKGFTEQLEETTIKPENVTSMEMIVDNGKLYLVVEEELITIPKTNVLVDMHGKPLV